MANPLTISARQTKQEQQANGTKWSDPMPQAPSGFWENAARSVGDYFAENASISEAINYNKHRSPRNRQLDDMIDDGTIPADIVEAFTAQQFEPKVDVRNARGETITGTRMAGEIDYAGMADWAAENGLDVFTDDQLQDNIRTGLAERRAESAEVYANSTAMGSVGMVAGGFVGPMGDPINVLSMLIPGGQAKAGATIGQSVLRTGAAAAAINAATEFTLQMPVVSYKDHIDSPYDWSDGLVNVAFAGAAGFALGGAFGGVQGYRQNLQAQRTAAAERASNTRQAEDLADRMSTMDRESPEYKRLDQQRARFADENYRPPEPQQQTTEYGQTDYLGRELREEVALRAETLPDRAKARELDPETGRTMGDEMAERAQESKKYDDFLVCHRG